MEALTHITTLIIAFGILVAIGAVALLPAIIANKKDHSSKTSILVLTVFLSWIPFVWLIALIWALSGDKGAAALERELKLTRKLVEAENQLAKLNRNKGN